MSINPETRRQILSGLYWAAWILLVTIVVMALGVYYSEDRERILITINQLIDHPIPRGPRNALAKAAALIICGSLLFGQMIAWRNKKKS